MRETQNAQTKRNNKRSFVIVALLLLLVAVIGFGGYTLAKYITKKDAAGSASVAKWGFTVETKTDELFGANYKYGTDASIVTTDTADAANLTVKADGNRVAPGTTGSMTFSVKGQAEVKAQIQFNLDVTSDVALKYTKGEAAAETYAPVKWTLKKNGETVNGAENVTLAAIATALNETATYTYNAGAAAVSDEYTLSWAWDFETNDENNALDTLLGMYATNANNTTNGDYTVVADGTYTEIKFTLNISVVQLEK